MKIIMFMFRSYQTQMLVSHVRSKTGVQHPPYLPQVDHNILSSTQTYLQVIKQCKLRIKYICI